VGYVLGVCMDMLLGGVFVRCSRSIYGVAECLSGWLRFAVVGAVCCFGMVILFFEMIVFVCLFIGHLGVVF